jgi:hypothetical protein
MQEHASLQRSAGNSGKMLLGRIMARFSWLWTAMPSRDQQVDFRWTIGLSAATPDHSIGFGYSVRFQAIR